MTNYKPLALGVMKYGALSFTGFLALMALGSLASLKSMSLIGFGYIGSIILCLSFYYLKNGKEYDKMSYLLIGWYFNAAALLFGAILFGLEKIKEST